MAQNSASGSAMPNGASSIQGPLPPVIPINIPPELWQGRLSNGIVIATMTAGANTCFFQDHGPGEITLDPTPSQTLTLQHYRNFDSPQDINNHFAAIRTDVNTTTLEITRRLPLDNIVTFTERNPDLKTFVFGQFRADFTLPLNTTRVLLFPLPPDETTKVAVIWFCRVEDDIMIEELSNFLGQPFGTYYPVATLPPIGPFNAYIAVASGP